MSAEPIRSFRSSIAPARAVVDCAHCPTATACIVGGCSREDLNRWNDAMFSHIPLTMPGTTLFSVGDSADAVFIVRAGCIKTFTTDSEGNERVRGFHFPGSIVGLDTLGNTRWASNACAISASQVCHIDKNQLRALLQQSPDLARRLLERTSASLSQALALSGDYSADQRVAAFLLLMQDCASTPKGIRLPMTRRDIANYLRLATETVCRVLTRFEQQGWLTSEPRLIRLLDTGALWNLAEAVGLCTAPDSKRLAA